MILFLKNISSSPTLAGFFVSRHLGLVECNIGLMKRLWLKMDTNLVDAKNYYFCEILTLSINKGISYENYVAK